MSEQPNQHNVLIYFVSFVDQLLYFFSFNDYRLNYERLMILNWRLFNETPKHQTKERA